MATSTQNLPAVPQSDKPLNQTQLKNLQQLVAGDFEDLRTHILTDIDNRKSRRLQEVAAEYEDTTPVEKARQKLIDAQRKAEDAVNKAINDALKDPKVQVAPGYSVFGGIKLALDAIRLAGRKEALDGVEKASVRLKNTAIRILNAQERQVQRQVLLQGITAVGAQELIRDLPQREDIVALVELELSMGEGSDDIAALMPTSKPERQPAKKVTKKATTARKKS